MNFEARKLYYKIGEVCEILGVEAHVLRYWETEFPSLSPPKNKAGQRTYRPKDIEQLLEIRRLLYEEGYTIAGARKRLSSRSISPARIKNKASAPAKTPGRAAAAAAKKADAPAQKVPGKRINEVREELENILTLLRGE
jgi:DNA-binding transcriptional MerR regulator